MNLQLDNKLAALRNAVQPLKEALEEALLAIRDADTLNEWGHDEGQVAIACEQAEEAVARLPEAARKAARKDVPLRVFSAKTAAWVQTQIGRDPHIFKKTSPSDDRPCWQFDIPREQLSRTRSYLEMGRLEYELV